MATVRLAQGSVRGTQSSANATTYYAIPYAKYNGRFASASPVAPGTVEYDATRRGVICPQSASRLARVTGPYPLSTNSMAEDCLLLSVAVPTSASSSAEKRPVMVFLHGGAYVTGAGQLAWYDGYQMAGEGNVIVVSVNYRLGALGYLYDESRPLGLGTEDALLALDWVSSNIGAFGGDAAKVTLFGQSAGAYTTQLLVNAGSDLFSGAIVQSSPTSVVLTSEQAQKVRGDFETHLRDVLHTDLLGATSEQILEAQGAAMTNNSNLELPFAPVTAAGPLGVATNHLAPKDILMGWMKDDASVFVDLKLESLGVPQLLRPPLVLAATGPATAAAVADPARRLAQKWRTEQGHRTTLYENTWRPRDAAYGAAHVSDMPLFLGDEEAWKAAPMLGSEPWQTQWGPRGHTARAFWTAFATNATVGPSFDNYRIGI